MRIGVDLGGTKIEAIAIGDRGEELLRRRILTPRDDYEATLHAIRSLVEDLEETLARTGTVGVGTPGALSGATGLLKNSNSTCLNGRPLKDDLSRVLKRPVRMTNDANCFALSEAVDGAAAGAAVVFGVIIGTGTGGGVVVSGQVLTGPNAIAGEWGHNPLPWPEADELPGPPCYCGKAGCIETFLSGPGLSGDYLRTAGDRRDASEVVSLAEKGDPQAESCLSRYERRMARSLASIINVLDPDVIVLGGGMSNIDQLYESIPRLWGAWVFSDTVETRLVRARHGDSSGVRGAAWLWEAPSVP
ncbi:MAG: ROK family protein [Thermoanaerobaculia bacterium]|nr:ROK family protein [Thermoanaerobaculia bacterium]